MRIEPFFNTIMSLLEANNSDIAYNSDVQYLQYQQKYVKLKREIKRLVFVSLNLIKFIYLIKGSFLIFLCPIF